MSKERISDLTLLVISIFWGTTFILTKNALQIVGPLTFLSLRYIIAFLCLITLFHKKVKKCTTKKLFTASIWIGTLSCIGMILQVTGLKYTLASKSAFITGLNVIIVPIIAAIIFRNKPRFFSVIGVFLSLLGLFLLTSGSSGGFNFGDFLTLLCAICFAFYITLIDKYTKIFESIAFSVIQIGIAALLCTLAALLTENYSLALSLSPPLIIAILVTGIPATAFAIIGQTIAQKYTTPTKTALIFATEPVFGALFAFIIPNKYGIRESLSILGWGGCALILAGMLISEIKTSKNQ